MFQQDSFLFSLLNENEQKAIARLEGLMQNKKVLETEKQLYKDAFTAIYKNAILRIDQNEMQEKFKKTFNL